MSTYFSTRDTRVFEEIKFPPETVVGPHSSYPGSDTPSPILLGPFSYYEEVLPPQCDRLRTFISDYESSSVIETVCGPRTPYGSSPECPRAPMRISYSLSQIPLCLRWTGVISSRPRDSTPGRESRRSHVEPSMTRTSPSVQCVSIPSCNGNELLLEMERTSVGVTY